MPPTVHAIYQRYSDNVARSASIEIETGTPAAEDVYGPAALVDGAPERVAKIESTTAAWVLDHGSATPVEIVGLIHHTLNEGADVKIQRNSSNSWGSPAFEADITIPAWEGSGQTLWPVNPWLDLTQVAGYSAPGWQYTRIVVTSNGQNVHLGQLWLGRQIRRFTRNWDRGAEEMRSRPTIEPGKTAFGIEAIYGLATSGWSLPFTITGVDETLRAELKAQWDDCGGRYLPWLFVPNGLVNECRFVRWATTDEKFKRQFTSLSDYAAQVTEVARGLRPGA